MNVDCKSLHACQVAERGQRRESQTSQLVVALFSREGELTDRVCGQVVGHSSSVVILDQYGHVIFDGDVLCEDIHVSVVIIYEESV